MDIRSFASTVLPDTIQDLIVERLDALPQFTRRILQTAAVIGSAFDSVIAAPMRNEEGETIGALYLAREEQIGFEYLEEDVEQVERIADVLTPVLLQQQKLAQLEQKERSLFEFELQKLGMVIVLPPLRERPEDIPVLANHFVRKYAARYSRQAKGIDDRAMSKLLMSDWKGNVRSLEHTIERALVLAEGPTITADDLNIDEEESADKMATWDYDKAQRDFSKDFILKALCYSGGNRRKAARLMGISHARLYRIMAKIGLHQSSTGRRATSSELTQRCSTRSRGKDPIRS